MAGGSTKAVYAAIVANSIVAVLKFIGFAFSGSGAMLSEGIHSIADVTNQLLLAVGIKRAEREADEDHPYGYGRDKFVFAMISAVGIFWFGCGVTLYHGITSLLHPHPVAALELAIGILVVSGLIESVTLWIAWVAVRDGAKKDGMALKEYLLKGSDPMGVAVLLEDGAAVLGILIALATLGLSLATGNLIFDAIGSILIGVLLGAVAAFLVVKNRTVLLGLSMSTQNTSRVVEILSGDPVVESVHDVKTTVLGTDQTRFKAEIQFDGEAIARRFLITQDLATIWERINTEDELRTFLIEYGDHIVEALGDEIDRLEDKVRLAAPEIRHVDLEAE
ncbi:MAG: zinc transporter 9 [Myxococcota bacterium]|jgi:zinc transporter 9